jgi:glycosyltransferase involved in cell wall biosynthesis
MWAPLRGDAAVHEGRSPCARPLFPPTHPRPCGIATFARDLTEALRSADATLDVDVIAIVREPTAHLEPEVLAVIGQDVLDDYIRLPSLLDDRCVDVVLIEHEFGIFGGDAGSHLLSLVRDLRQPFVLTLHTVLAEPSPEQASILRELCARAAFVTIFTETARRMVVDAGLVGADNLRVVPHGAPVELFPDYSAPRANPPLCDSESPLDVRVDLRGKGHRGRRPGAGRHRP